MNWWQWTLLTLAVFLCDVLALEWWCRLWDACGEDPDRAPAVLYVAKMLTFLLLGLFVYCGYRTALALFATWV